VTVKQPTNAIMKAIVESCPGALVLVLNFDEENGTADVAMTVAPRTAAVAMRAIGTDLCRSLEIGPDPEPN
jgi:hypothetical protein